MPINCPIPYSEDLSCLDCSSCYNEKCNRQFRAVPLSDILTEQEQIDMLRRELAKLKEIAPSYVLADIRKDLNNAIGEMRHFKGQFNEHITPQKKKKLQKPTEEKEEGVTQV